MARNSNENGISKVCNDFANYTYLNSNDVYDMAALDSAVKLVSNCLSNKFCTVNDTIMTQQISLNNATNFDDNFCQVSLNTEYSDLQCRTCSNELDSKGTCENCNRQFWEYSTQNLFSKVIQQNSVDFPATTSSCNSSASSCSSPVSSSSVSSSSSRSSISSPSTTSTCDQHESKCMTLYCKTCFVTLCDDCVSESVHSGHDMMTIEEASLEYKAMLRSDLDQAEKVKHRLEKLLQSNQGRCVGIERKIKSIKTEISNTFGAHVTALKRREDDLLGQLGKIRHMKQTSLQLQLKEIREGQRTASNMEEFLQCVVNHSTESDTIKANEYCIPQLRALWQKAEDCIVKEDHHIELIQPDSALLNAIRGIGHIRTSGFGPFCSAFGKGLHQPICGHQAKFAIRVLDCLGQQTTDSDRSDIHVNILTPNRKECKAVVSKLTNEVYDVAYVPTVIGKHLVFVFVNERHIQCSPFSVNVRAAKDYVTVREPIVEFGQEGNDDGQLCRPWGICNDKSGNILVADRSNNRIQVFYPDGRFKQKFGSAGSRTGEFNRPAGIATDHLDRIIVADKDNHRIQIFDAEGGFMMKFGENGNRNGQFNYPWDVAVNSVGNILVSDTRNHRIQLFDSTGKFINKYSFTDEISKPQKYYRPQGWRTSDSPRGVAFSLDGQIIATDFNNHRVVIIHPSLHSVMYLGGEGSQDGQFLRPQGVAVDQQGNIIVADCRNNRIQIFNSSGQFVCKFGSEGKLSGEMDRPSGVCVSPEGNIVVVDFGNNRIQVF